jgi:hypothetical protein
MVAGRGKPPPRREGARSLRWGPGALWIRSLGPQRERMPPEREWIFSLSILSRERMEREWVPRERMDFPRRLSRCATAPCRSPTRSLRPPPGCGAGRKPELGFGLRVPGDCRWIFSRRLSLDFSRRLSLDFSGDCLWIFPGDCPGGGGSKVAESPRRARKVLAALGMVAATRRSREAPAAQGARSLRWGLGCSLDSVFLDPRREIASGFPEIAPQRKLVGPLRRALAEEGGA